MLGPSRSCPLCFRWRTLQGDDECELGAARRGRRKACKLSVRLQVGNRIAGGDRRCSAISQKTHARRSSSQTYREPPLDNHAPEKSGQERPEEPKSCSEIESLGLGLERNRAVTRAFSPGHKPWRKSSPTAWRCSQDSNRKWRFDCYSSQSVNLTAFALTYDEIRTRT
jgi:hypothetical protein